MLCYNDRLLLFILLLTYIKVGLISPYFLRPDEVPIFVNLILFVIIRNSSIILAFHIVKILKVKQTPLYYKGSQRAHEEFIRGPQTGLFFCLH